MRHFEGEVYGVVYIAMLDLIAEVKDNPYHGQKFSLSQQTWAQARMYEGSSITVYNIFADFLTGG